MNEDIDLEKLYYLDGYPARITSMGVITKYMSIFIPTEEESTPQQSQTRNTCDTY
jgi:hypothetical protein